MSSIKKKKAARTTQLISPPILGRMRGEEDRLHFSFKYLCTDHERYSYSSKDTEYFMKVLERMKGLCCISALEFKTKPTKTWRNHKVDWRDTSENSFGLPNEEQLVEEVWQFSISANEHGRVFGFFVGNIFNIVWFDPDHLVYGG